MKEKENVYFCVGYEMEAAFNRQKMYTKYFEVGTKMFLLSKSLIQTDFSQFLHWRDAYMRKIWERLEFFSRLA